MKKYLKKFLILLIIPCLLARPVYALDGDGHKEASQSGFRSIIRTIFNTLTFRRGNDIQRRIERLEEENRLLKVEAERGELIARKAEAEARKANAEATKARAEARRIKAEARKVRYTNVTQQNQ